MRKQFLVGVLLCVLGCVGACGVSSPGDDEFVSHDTAQTLSSLISESGDDPVYEQSLPSLEDAALTLTCTGKCTDACIAVCKNGTIGRPPAVCKDGECVKAATRYCSSRKGIAVACRGYLKP